MATNREMLKEAIADAKAVKETAIANAKVALEEAFTPQLKSMFAAKLQEMDEVEEMEDKMYEMEDDKNPMEENEDEKKMMEVDLEELLRELELEEDDTLNEAEEGEEDEESEEPKESDEEGEPLDLEDLTDEDLKDMIEDVIKDMIEKGELEAGHEGEEGEESEESEISVEDEEVDLAELLKEIEEMDEMEEPIDEVSATGLSDIGAMAAMAGVFTGIGIPLLRQYFSQRKADNKALEKLAKDVKGLSPEQAEKKISDEIAKIAETSTKMDSESMNSENMNSELSEAYSTIKVLKSELNEINLLNAKLLYTNKIFKAKNLNESQKVKVLTSFDRAKNVGEVKMVFETLNEGIKVSKNIIKENLGRASKGTMTPNVNKPIVESNEAFLRMQKLAGII